MQEQPPTKFQIGRNDGENDAIMRTELQELKIEKLGQRVMLLTILIPCMIGIIIIISYLDIKGRVTRTESTGTIGVQKLSQDLDSKFSSLSLEQAKLKEVQDKKLPELEKSSAFSQTRLKKLQESVKALEASKIEREELTQLKETLNEKYDAIPEHLQNEMEYFRMAEIELQTEAAALSKQLDEAAEAFDQLSQQMAGLQADIASVSSTKIDKNELELALKLKEIGYRQEILEATGSLKKKIKALQSRVDRLDKAAARPPAAQPKPVQAEKKPETAPATPKPAPGTIEEQSIE